MDAIEVHDLHKRYGPRTAVDGVGFRAAPGTVLGLLGPNGAGKTTTVECVAGLRRPDAGSVRVLGLDPITDRARVRSVLGVQLQEVALHDALTVAELARLHRSFHRRGADVAALLDAVGLTEQAGTRFARLSGGQQQRLSVALALVGRPRVVILDELSTGLDPQGRRSMTDLVRTQVDDGVTVLLVSHRMDEVAELCQGVVLLDRGRVVAEDSPSGLVAASGLPDRVRFRVSGSFDRAVVSVLPQVVDVVRAGDEVTITGSGDLLDAVSTALARHGIVATGTRLEQPSLEDAFLALTGRRVDAGAVAA